MSCRINSKLGLANKCEILRLLPVKKLSRQSTSSPRATKLSQRCEPRKPAPPVTKILCNFIQSTVNVRINKGGIFINQYAVAACRCVFPQQKLFLGVGTKKIKTVNFAWKSCMSLVSRFATLKSAISLKSGKSLITRLLKNLTSVSAVATSRSELFKAAPEELTSSIETDQV